MSYGKAEGLRTALFVDNSPEKMLEEQLNEFFEGNPDAEILDVRFVAGPHEKAKKGVLLWTLLAWVIYRPSEPSVYETRGMRNL